MRERLSDATTADLLIRLATLEAEMAARMTVSELAVTTFPTTVCRVPTKVKVVSTKVFRATGWSEPTTLALVPNTAPPGEADVSPLTFGLGFSDTYRWT
jgi:hypothetical protein